MSTRALPDISDMRVLSPLACGPWASGINIRQSTHVHIITIKYIYTQGLWQEYKREAIAIASNFYCI